MLAERIRCVKNPLYYLNNYGHVFDAKQKKITRMKCFPYQERCVVDFHKFQNNIVLKSRQCLPGDTFVDTPDGPKPIQKLQVGDLLYSYNLETNKVEMDTVSDSWNSGVKQCLKIKLKDSRNIEIGENHPFWVVNKQDWIRAQDLEINDEILDANIEFGDISVDEDEIKLLAYLITDGCTNKQVKFTNNSLDYLLEFEESVYKCFPELEIRKSPKLNGFDYFPHQKHGVNTLNPIMEWCEIKGIANKKTEFKNLPEEVFYWNKNSVSLLINRIFAGDGWISILKKDTSKRIELGIGSPSLIFLEQLKTLLKKYNIKGNIYEVKNMKLQQNKFYKLRITHSKSTSKFINEIGIYKKIRPEHLEIIKNRKHDVKSTSVVRKIEKTALKECYDISVTKNENFLINGLLVHNTGLSVITAGYVAWRLMFRYEEKILIIANQGSGAIRFLDTVKQFIENTPDWLLPTTIAKKNQTELEFAKPHGSWIKALASSPDAGRGEALTMLVLDETAFIKDDEQIWMGAGMALSMTQGKCIMISTPNGTGSLYHKTWVGAINDDNDFNPLQVHWTENPLASVGLEKRIDLRGNEVFWSPWYEDQCTRLGNDSVKIAQELDLSFEGSKYLAIESELIEKHEKKTKTKKPNCYIKYDFLYKGELKAGNFIIDETHFHVWKTPEKNKMYIVGCLPPGEKVLTNNGLKNIEDIVSSDMLISENGEYVNIINQQIYPVIEEDIYKIKVDNTYRTTVFTKEHPILVSQNTKLKRPYDVATKKEGKRYWDFDFKYTKTDELNIGDWIKTPNIYKKELNLNINDKWKFSDENKIRQDFKIESPISDKDFWWFIGLWLGDGWIGQYGNSHSITVCFNKKEYYYLEKCKAIIEKLFNRTPSITERDSTYDITFNSKELYCFILENFGQYSYGKKISEWVKFIPKEYKLELIKGYFDSDGCWIKKIKNKRYNSKISFVSINLELLESIQDILFSIGVISSLNKLRNAKKQIICGKASDCKECYNLNLANFDSLKLIGLLNDKEDIKLNKFKITDFYNVNNRIISSCHFSENEDFIYFKIKNIEQYKFTGNVYNFECDTHTFMCHHITTHNCDIARGDGKDFSTIQVLDAETLEQVAEYRDKIGVDLLPYLVDWVGRTYNMAYLVVEANSFGLGVGFDLRDTFNYKRMFFSKNVGDIHVRPSDFKIPEGVEIPGFQTTRRTRPLLVKAIIEHMRENSLIINSPRLISEMKTFIMKGERPEAEQGFNDDLIFALGLALYIRDTEYNNVTKSNKAYINMLDSIIISSSSFSETKTDSEDYVPGRREAIQKKSDLDFPMGGSGLFVDNENTVNPDSDDDLSWLTG